MREPDGFVFREGAHGLEFVGDFDGLYSSTQDPWAQSGEGSDYATQRYYARARSRLIEVIRRNCPRGGDTTGIEVGCGHGHVVSLLNDLLPSEWVGMDISPAAISRALTLYPYHRFFVGDILKDEFSDESAPTFDVVLLGQVLWYVMHKMDIVIKNARSLLKENGVLVIQQALLRDQRYGQEIAHGFDGLVKLLLRYDSKFNLVEARYVDDEGLAFNDGLLVLRKR